MNFEQKKIARYCSNMSSPRGEVLEALERRTHLTTLAPQMLTGHTQGLLLQFIAQMIQPDCILEIGTFTGYSTICLAKGLSKNGTLHTIEINPERKAIIDEFVSQSGNKDQIKCHFGDAKNIIPNLDVNVNLVFIDAAKLEYEHYYKLVIDKVVPGGFLIIDNVLWGGKVVDGQTDPDTLAIHSFNVMIKADDRVENVILPIRDGITLIRKR